MGVRERSGSLSGLGSGAREPEGSAPTAGPPRPSFRAQPVRFPFNPIIIHPVLDLLCAVLHPGRRPDWGRPWLAGAPLGDRRLSSDGAGCLLYRAWYGTDTVEVTTEWDEARRLSAAHPPNAEQLRPVVVPLTFSLGSRSRVLLLSSPPPASRGAILSRAPPSPWAMEIECWVASCQRLAHTLIK